MANVQFSTFSFRTKLTTQNCHQVFPVFQFYVAAYKATKTENRKLTVNGENYGR